MTFSIQSQTFEPQGHGGVRIDLQTDNGRVTLTSDSFTELPGIARGEAVEVPNSGVAVIGVEFSGTDNPEHQHVSYLPTP